ncbi:MAG: hypothetical protein JF617_14480, partial [Burkholderiales bacterium]|nr:hypothetical protein [Burkholderiales bacterium]
GGWIGDLGDGVFNFSARTSSSVAALDGHVLNMRIGFHVTTGCTPDYSVCKPNDPVLNADYFYSLPSADYPGVKLDYVGVYELESGLGNTGSVDLYAKIGSLLPVALANPVNVTLQPAIPSPVPEPSMLVLMVGGRGFRNGRRGHADDIDKIPELCRKREHRIDIGGPSAILVSIRILIPSRSSSVNTRGHLNQNVAVKCDIYIFVDIYFTVAAIRFDTRRTTCHTGVFEN